MATNINAQDCKKYVRGTGLTSCELRLKQPTSFLRVNPSWVFDPETETFNLDYVIGKVQDGTFTPFMNTLEFVDNTPDPTTKEYQGGAMATIRNGKPQYSFEFDNGLGFHKAAYSYNGFRTSSIIMIDKQGNVFLYSNVAGDKLTAMLTNNFNARTYKPVVGDDTAKTIVELQIDNEEAFNTRLTVITAAEVGADLNEELKGIIDVTITATPTQGDPIQLTVIALNNVSFGIESLAASNLRIRVLPANTVINITTLTAGATPGTYTATPATALTSGQSIVIETYDSTVPAATARIADTNQLYKGITQAITVASVVVMIFSPVFNSIFA